MPIPPNLAKQELHNAYFLAVVADAGATAAKPTPDIGIDFIVSGARIRKDGKYAPTGYLFQCQLKSTTDWNIQGDKVVYAVKADAYNDLAELGKGIGVLIVFCLPKDHSSPLKVTEQYLQLSNCCYWYRVPREPIPNTGSKTIEIPRSHIFDRNAVAHLLELDKTDANSEQRPEK